MFATRRVPGGPEEELPRCSGGEFSQQDWMPGGSCSLQQGLLQVAAAPECVLGSSRRPCRLGSKARMLTHYDLPGDSGSKSAHLAGPSFPCLESEGLDQTISKTPLLSLKSAFMMTQNANLGKERN